VSEVDEEVLRYVARHPFVLVSHVQALLDLQEQAAAERLASLSAEGLIRLAPRLRNQLAGYQVTRSGLAQIGSDLPVPRVDLRRYWHDIGVGWLWVAARNGVFGEIERVFSEREMRAADKADAAAKYAFDLELSPAVRAKAADASFGIRLESGATRGPVPMHYPDLVLVVPSGRLAVQLQLKGVGRDPLEAILSGYGLKPSITDVLFLVDSSAVGLAVQASAARLGLARSVHVQKVHLDRAIR
jgi:hypothetical protein